MSRIAESLAPDLFTPNYPASVPVEVCELFEEVALQVSEAGFDRYSARAIAHRLRWHQQIEKGNREFKMNNLWTAPLARWFLARHPELPDFFETRGDE